MGSRIQQLLLYQIFKLWLLEVVPTTWTSFCHNHTHRHCSFLRGLKLPDEAAQPRNLTEDHCLTCDAELSGVARVVGSAGVCLPLESRGDTEDEGLFAFWVRTMGCRSRDDHASFSDVAAGKTPCIISTWPVAGGDHDELLSCKT